MYTTNTKEDPLFELIKSLSNTEKSNFRKFVTLHIKGKTNNYVKLFEIIDLMDSYKESYLKKALGSKNAPKQLHRVKNYLYHQILKSLRSYHADITIDGQLKNTLRDVEVLYSKGMYIECKVKLTNSKTLAYKYEKLTRIVEILEWEIKLIPKDIGFEDQANTLKNLFSERKLILEQKLNLYKYELCFNNLYALCKSNNKIRETQQLEPFNRIVNQDIFKGEERALSLQAKVLYNFCWGIYYFCSGKWDNVNKAVKRRLELLESRPDLISDVPHQYINVLANMLSVNTNLGTILQNDPQVHDKQFFDTSKNLKRFSRSWRSVLGSKEIEQRVFSNTTIHEIGYYISRGEFDKAINIAEKNESQMELLFSNTGSSTELAYLYYTAYAYLGKSNYRNALKYINVVLNNNYFEIRNDLQCFSRILNLLIHYELGNIFVLENAIMHTRRFIKKKGLFFKQEKIILSFFRKASLLKFEDANTEQKGLLEFKKRLLQSNDSEYSSNFDEYHHLFWWIESKIQDKPLSLIVQKGILNK